MAVTEDFWDDLLAHLTEQVLVPFVGPELLRVDGGRHAVTLPGVIAERLAERYSLPLAQTADASLDDVVRVFLASRGRAESERLYRVVNDLLIALDAEPPQALQTLAAIDDFRVFVSTTFDSLLTRALDQVRFDGQRGTRELWFAPNQSTLEQQKNARPPAADEATVFKLFGQASSTAQYALHDEDVLEWLHALLTDTARLPEWLGYQLRQSPLLFVGCRIPDWIGRFLIRMASGTRLSLASKQFFIVGTAAREPLLAEFFATYCGATRVQMLDADPAAFVTELRDRWRARRAQAGPPGAEAEPRERGTIFISYAREDAAAAERLCNAITALGGDVWLDRRRLRPGDAWEDDILSGIRRGVGLFVPLISTNTERRDEGYVFREWAEALKRSTAIPHRRFIVPVVIDTAYDGNPARYTHVQEELRRFHFGHAPGGHPDAALGAVLTEEIRAMRRSREVA